MASDKPRDVKDMVTLSEDRPVASCWRQSQAIEVDDTAAEDWSKGAAMQSITASSVYCFNTEMKKRANALFFCKKLAVRPADCLSPAPAYSAAGAAGAAGVAWNGVSRPTIWPKIFGLAAMMSPLYR